MACETVRSVCPYDCPDACGLLIEVEDGRAVSVKGDPEHPHTKGFLCGKMNRYQDTVHSPRRLTTPLLRIGAKGTGQFQPISWDEAIEQICNRWREIIDQYGAEAILPYSYAGTMGQVQRNAGHPFFHRLGTSLLERTICASAKGIGWEMVMGKTPAPRPDQVEQSDFIILWGSNTAATSIHTLPGVKKARANGAKVWLIETYKTPTAAIADNTVLVTPGSDGALALGLMHILVRDNLTDDQFLAEKVQGFSELKSQILPDYPPERVSKLTGVDIPTLEQLAKSFGQASAPYIHLGSGLSRYINGAMNVRSIVTLPALVGAYGKPGAGCFVGTSTGSAYNMKKIERADFLTGMPRTINMNQLGDALTKPLDPPVASLYVYHANPAAVNPDQNQVLAGLARENLFTVVHERFMTDTALYADIVLPACSSLETSDIYRSYGHYYTQRSFPVIPPVGQSKSNWDTFALLAQGMGFDDPIFQSSAEEMIEQLLDSPSPLLSNIDMETFSAGKAVELNIPSSDSYATPSGKIEILNPKLDEHLPCYLPPYKGDYPLRLMTAPSLYALNSSFQERDDLRNKQEAMLLQINPQEAASRHLADGKEVCAFNELGEVTFILKVTDKVPLGIAVAEGVWWMEFAPGKRSVNALTSQRLTDAGNGSTFYDNTIDVRSISG
jgi:anaerobic selenocysteine-containing dehydrogenase